MATPTSAQAEPKAKSSRVVFYIVMAVAIAVLLIAARIMGMPRGSGVEHEPQESSSP